MRTILVVQPDPCVCQLLSDVLTGVGYAVVFASDGLAGLASLRYTIVDLIICDLAMTHLDGVAFCLLLRADRRYRRLPVLAMCFSEDRRRFPRTLATAFAAKPVAVPALLAQIQNLLAAPALLPRVAPGRAESDDPRVSRGFFH